MKGASLIPRAQSAAEAILIPVVAIIAALIVFALFAGTMAHASPFDVLFYVYRGGFATSHALQDTIVRSSPLLLAALCTALPARLGLVIIGGEGALALGGIFAAVTPEAIVHFIPNANPYIQLILMCAVGFAVGGIWIALAGALKYYRGVNETISSLLLFYVALAIFNQLVEGAWRDPMSLNKPSTPPLDPSVMINNIPGTTVHWGPVVGVVCCILAYLFMQHTTIGFAARIAGGNLRAARVAGLSVGKLILLVCFLGGGAAGLAGAIEVAAIDGQANYGGLVAGYGFTGILIAFMARQSPLGIIPVSFLLGGIEASRGLLQRRLDLPDASTLVLQGILFVMILASESYYGRFKIFRHSAVIPSDPPAPPAAPAAVEAKTGSEVTHV
jgi:general nucleoside transport system permease protein